MVERIKELYKDEEGATMVEYALMLALIAVVAMAAVQAIGGTVNATFTSADEALNGTVPGGETGG